MPNCPSRAQLVHSLSCIPSQSGKNVLAASCSTFEDPVLEHQPGYSWFGLTPVLIHLEMLSPESFLNLPLTNRVLSWLAACPAKPTQGRARSSADQHPTGTTPGSGSHRALPAGAHRACPTSPAGRNSGMPAGCRQGRQPGRGPGMAKAGATCQYQPPTLPHARWTILDGWH